MIDKSERSSDLVSDVNHYTGISLQGTVLAFDFGEKRIGIAVGNTALRQAQPLTTIHSEKTERRFFIIRELIESWQPALLVVGLPSHLDGSEQEMTRLSRRFARRLAGRFQIQVLMVDERYTSRTAGAELRQSGVSGRRQKQFLDEIAAQHILQSYFDEYYEQHFTA